MRGESAATSAHFEMAPVRGGLAFIAQSTFDRRGLYWWTPTTAITLVANYETPVPGSSESFNGFFATIGLQEGLVFSGSFPSGSGLFLVRAPGAPIEPFVVPGDPTADGEVFSGVFFNPGGPAHGSGSLLAFSGFTAGNPASPSTAEIEGKSSP